MSFFRYFGVLALAVGWITITISIMLNPWFSIMNNALSDLGALGLKHAWVFNLGLTISGFFAVLYSIYLLWATKSKLEALASSIFFLSAVHLILIAAFPEGTYPHLLVSFEFFILSGISILVFGIALMVQGNPRFGLTFSLLSAVGFISAALAPWPSTGSLEVFAIILMSVWAALMLKHV